MGISTSYGRCVNLYERAAESLDRCFFVHGVDGGPQTTFVRFVDDGFQNRSLQSETFGMEQRADLEPNLTLARFEVDLEI